MPSQTDRYSVGQMTTRRLVIFDAQNAASIEPWSQQFHALNVMLGKVEVSTNKGKG